MTAVYSLTWSQGHPAGAVIAPKWEDDWPQTASGGYENYCMIDG